MDEAALEGGIPTVLTLHNYWFMCPLITLFRRDGRICEGAVPPADCVWWLVSHKRRYRLPDRGLDGQLGDVFVRLSQSRILANAMGVNSRVVAARFRGMAELIQHGKNGLLFEPGSVKSLTAQLQRLLDEPTLLSHLQAGIQPVPSIEEETATLISLYQSLWNKRPPTDVHIDEAIDR